MGKLLPTATAEYEGTVCPAEGPFVESISPNMRPVESVIRELAQSDVPVLLLAEPGAGKYAIAQRIHGMSRRSGQPLRFVQCASLRKKDDLEIVRRGQNGTAAAGTIFLEEVADLQVPLQSYLRGVLSEVSGNGHGTSTRFICGSAKDLALEVKSGKLEEDFYYQISSVCLRLPPLRQRKEDIPLLVEHFLHRYAEEYHRPIPVVSSETMRLFQEYAWPGNLHELEAAARVLVALGDEHLAMGGLRVLLQKPASNGNGNGISLKAASRAASHEAERELILSVLTRNRWNRRRAAEELHISYKALLYKLKQIGLEGHGAS